nr:hypothetical protein B0A51_07612 [Rachicladosporium sp. CCFEE 5018]
MEDADTPPSATVYVRNLDERIKIPALIEALHGVFDEFGEIVDIIAKRSNKRKGQAFIVYTTAEAAQEAIDELQGFELFGKQIGLEFARTRSDATVEKEDGEEGLEAHKKHRLAEKERKQALEAAELARAPKRPADTEELPDRPSKTAKPTAANAVIPDEYLPPAKTLFLQELPEDYGHAALEIVFKRFPGFREIRLVPTRKTIAFVEYEDEAAAITAKEAVTGMAMGGQPIKVSYQRQR